MVLAHAGIPTVLVEKNRILGGSCAGYDKRGFKIDIGTHLFCRGPKGPLGDALRRVGRDGAITFRRTGNIAQIRTTTLGAPLTLLDVPSARHRYPAFLLELARIMQLPATQLAKAVRMFAHILSMSDEEVESWNDDTVEDFLLHYTNDPALISLFGFLLGLYFILPYWEVSAGEAFWSFKRMVRDNWLSYPLGGSRAIPETYCRIAESFGAEVRTGTGVRRVVVKDDGVFRRPAREVAIEKGANGDGGPWHCAWAGSTQRVCGVELDDGTFIPADLVVSTSSVRTTVKYLVGADKFPDRYVARANSIRGSHIAVQAKIALDTKLVSAGAIVGGVGENVDLFGVTTRDLKAMFNNVIDGKIPPVVPFYCPVPTNFDPTLAPPGCQLLTVCAVAPTSDITLQDPGPAWEEAMLATIRAVVPGIDEHTLFIDRFSVGFIENWIGKEFGPAVSTGQMPGQVGPDRPPVVTPIAGLYMAGCGAGARGVGTELAATSAMECADQILADLGRAASQPANPADADWRRPIVSRDRVARVASRALAWATRAG